MNATRYPYAKLFKVLTVSETATDVAPLLSTAELTRDYWNRLMPLTPLWNPDVEWFVVFGLNRKNRVIGSHIVSMGTATNSLVHPREVFRAVIVMGAAALVCAHNHPSGDPAPSTADIVVTRLLRDAAKTVCIDLLDHVIVGSPANDPAGAGYYSFRSAGLL